jgi:hypothetical protein
MSSPCFSCYLRCQYTLKRCFSADWMTYTYSYTHNNIRLTVKLQALITISEDKYNIIFIWFILMSCRTYIYIYISVFVVDISDMHGSNYFYTATLQLCTDNMTYNTQYTIRSYKCNLKIHYFNSMCFCYADNYCRFMLA